MLYFVTAKVNKTEKKISTTHHSVNKNTAIEEATSLIREEKKEQCTIDPDKKSWPPKLNELKHLPVPDSVKLFFQSLLATEKHGRVSDKRVPPPSYKQVSRFTNI